MEGVFEKNHLYIYVSMPKHMTNLSETTIADNTLRYFKAAAWAGLGALKVLENCRATPYIAKKVVETYAGIGLPTQALVAFALATEAATTKEILRRLRDGIDGCGSKAFHIKKQPHDKAIVLNVAPACALDPEADHASIGIQNILFSMMDILRIDLLPAVSAEISASDEALYQDNPLRNGKNTPDVRARVIQED